MLYIYGECLKCWSYQSFNILFIGAIDEPVIKFTPIKRLMGQIAACRGDCHIDMCFEPGYFPLLPESKLW
jgi:hypothetical protein